MKTLSLASVRTLREIFGDSAEQDCGDGRWVLFAAAMVRRSKATGRAAKDAGLNPRERGVAITLSVATTAKRARPRWDDGAIVMGRRRFDPDYVAAIEAAFQVCEWRMTSLCDFGDLAHAQTTDRVAFAYVAGHDEPVAALAPWRRRGS